MDCECKYEDEIYISARRMPSGTKSAGFLGHKTQDGLQGSQTKRQGRADRQGDMYNMKWPAFDNVSIIMLVD